MRIRTAHMSSEALCCGILFDIIIFFVCVNIDYHVIIVEFHTKWRTFSIRQKTTTKIQTLPNRKMFYKKIK